VIQEKKKSHNGKVGTSQETEAVPGNSAKIVRFQRVLASCRQSIVVFNCIHLAGQSDLTQVAGAFDAPAFLLGLIEGRQEETPQDQKS
jgi:hypothetical protein